MKIPPLLAYWTSDGVLFVMLQVGLIVFAVFVAVLDRWHKFRAGRGPITMRITRSPTSLGYFYGTYAAITGLFVSLSLTVELAKEHRVFWVLLDTVLIAYVCLLNFWVRNKLVGAADWLSKLEKR